jgi:hypothetical protein
MLKLRLMSAGVVVLLAACTTPQTGRMNAESAFSPDSYCVRETGTRIRSSASECVGAPGRVHVKSDLDRTGATTVAEALRLIDPRIR